MSQKTMNDIKPFLSMFIIIVTLFTVVFFKMEVRRVGYVVLKLSREERRIRDEHRERVVQLAKFRRPERLQNVAETRLTLKKAEGSQIIQMTDMGVALKQ